MEHMTQKKRCIYFLLALLFAVGFLGNLHGLETISFSSFTTDAGAQTVLRETGKETQMSEAKLTSVNMIHKMDDFHRMTSIQRTSAGHEESSKSTVQMMMLLIEMLLCIILLEKEKITFDRKRIPVFQMITFIHRIDGKKKSCFDAYI